MSLASQHPPVPANGPLAEVWYQPVNKLILIDDPALSAGQKERHKIYCLLVMALVAEYWNGNKRGPRGEYPWRKNQRLPDGTYQGGDYIGHNIAAIAVDREGDIIDFDFNHNELFNSSVEHAESRLIRRVFSLAQIQDGWATRKPGDPPKSQSYGTLLSDVSIYTSLESCSQCSGIMALGSVKEVIYLQRDPGQSSIGNILRNLAPIADKYRPPLPIPADYIGMDCLQRFEAAFSNYVTNVGQTPFYQGSNNYVDRSKAITSFLCTDLALEIFSAGAKDFEQYVAKEPGFRPRDRNGNEIQDAKTNTQVLEHARAFFVYAKSSGYRGTPHKL